MRSNRRTDTAPERLLRSELHRRGLRYRKDYSIRLPGAVRARPDVVFTRARLAVFIDGCFWHRCPVHGTMPKTNIEYWAPKLAANVARDRRVDGLLADDGWRVLRLWEHEDPEAAADRVVEALRGAHAAASERLSASAGTAPDQGIG
jgi:DNA mismatch endonuclease (patch repair protein)